MSRELADPERKAAILFASGAINYSGSTSSNRLKTVFNRWRKFILANHPDRNAQVDDTNIKLIADGSGGGLGHILQSNSHLRHAVFAIAILPHLGVFKQSAMNKFQYNSAEETADFIRSSVTRYNILARKEKKQMAKDALNVLLYRDTLNGELKTQYKEWDNTNSKARSKILSAPKSRARSRSVSIRRNGRLLLRGPSVARTPESQRDIILSSSHRSPPRVKKTKRTTTGAEIASLNAKRPCPDKNKVRWPPTNRCRKVKACPVGKVRNPLSGRCKKVKTFKPCKTNQRRNPETNRCRKI